MGRLDPELGIVTTDAGRDPSEQFAWPAWLPATPTKRKTPFRPRSSVLGAGSIAGAGTALAIEFEPRPKRIMKLLFPLLSPVIRRSTSSSKPSARRNQERRRAGESPDG